MKRQLLSLAPVKELIRTKLLEKYEVTTFRNTNSIELKVDAEEIINKYLDDKQLEEPEIYITPTAYLKMRMLVAKIETEIAWYGTVTQMPGTNKYVIEDILVYPQKVTGATAEQDDSRMFEFEMSLSTEQVNHKRFQGHSHVNMSTGPSGIDELFYDQLLTQVTDYFIITVTNKREEYTTRFYDVLNNVVYTEIPIQLIQDDGIPFTDWYEEQHRQFEKPIPAETTADKLNRVGNKDRYNKCSEAWEDPDAVWDPNLFEWITRAEYKEIYNADYKGEFDSYEINRSHKIHSEKKRQKKLKQLKNIREKNQIVFHNKNIKDEIV